MVPGAATGVDGSERTDDAGGEHRTAPMADHATAHGRGWEQLGNARELTVRHKKAGERLRSSRRGGIGRRRAAEPNGEKFPRARCWRPRRRSRWEGDGSRWKGKEAGVGWAKGLRPGRQIAFCILVQQTTEQQKDLIHMDKRGFLYKVQLAPLRV